LFDIDRRLNYGKSFFGFDTPDEHRIRFLGPQRRKKRKRKRATPLVDGMRMGWLEPVCK